MFLSKLSSNCVHIYKVKLLIKNYIKRSLYNSISNLIKYDKLYSLLLLFFFPECFTRTGTEKAPTR